MLTVFQVMTLIRLKRLFNYFSQTSFCMFNAVVGRFAVGLSVSARGHFFNHNLKMFPFQKTFCCSLSITERKEWKNLHFLKQTFVLSKKLRRTIDSGITQIVHFSNLMLIQMSCVSTCDCGRKLWCRKIENFLSLWEHNCLPKPHMSNARCVNQPLTICVSEKNLIQIQYVLIDVANEG